MKQDRRTILKQFLTQNWQWGILIFALLAILGFFRMYGAKYIEDITDLIASGTLKGLWGFIGIAVGSQVIFYCSRWLVAVICQYLTQKLTLELRIKVLEHLNGISFLTFENQKVGDLQSLVRNDIADAAELIYAIFSRILSNVFMVIFSWGYMCLMNWQVASLVLIGSILMGFINQKINQKINTCEYEVRQLRGGLSQTALHAFEGIEVVKTYGATQKTLESYGEKRDVYNQIRQQSIRLRSIREILFLILNNSALFGSVLYFAFQAGKGVYTIGEVMAFMALLIQVITPVGIIFRWMTQLTSSTASFKRIEEFLAIPVEEKIQVPLKEEIEQIRLEDISFAYPNASNIIEDFNCTLERGKIYNLSGESGSGKTTLIKVLLGLYTCQTMKVTLNNQVLERQNLMGLSSYVPSEPLLFQMSLYDNIAMGKREITLEKCMALVRELGIEEWIQSLPEGLETIVNENNRNLSGGQAQMIAILRAFTSEQPVLILDEPFSALDQDKEQYLEQLLNRLKAKRIILFTSHRASSLNCIDEKLVMGV